MICLGDLLLFVDYADYSQGIFPGLFGAEKARELVELRTALRFDEARAMSAALWAQLGGDPRQHIEQAVARQYAELFAAMPMPAYLTYGNVDLPRHWGDHVQAGQRVLDGERLDLDGRTFGFVGGGLRTTYRTPNELDDDVFDAKVAAIGPVDVLCSHIPPAVPDLLYDTVARRSNAAARPCWPDRADAAAVRPVRARAPAAAEPHQDRPDGVHQRGPFPGHRPAVCPAVVVTRRDVRRRGSGEVRSEAWPTEPARALSPLRPAAP